jgi:predicted O-methyltransferase YrrM
MMDDTTLRAGNLATGNSLYKFEFDWFSPHIPSFERFLSPLAYTPCTLLEIGSHDGRSATWLIDNLLQHSGATLDCIDLKIKDTLRENIQLSGQSRRVRLHEGYSRSILRKLPERGYDFIYVDGSHSTSDVLEDAVLSFGNLRTGGIVAFDDYLWDDPKFNQHGTPKAAVDAFLAVFARKVELLHQAHQVWLRKIED